MTKEWICVYCGSPNPHHTRFCTSCNARIPDWRQRFIGEEEEKPEEETAGVAAEEGPFPIPRPGDMVGGLFRITDEALSGKIPPEEFKERIATITDNVNVAFDGILTGINQIPVEDEEYRSFVRELLENVAFMLNVSLDEIGQYAENEDYSHIRFGRMLAQRAELEYIQIMEMLKSDASSNPFANEPNVLGNLASRIVEGKIGIEEFREKTVNLEKIIFEQIQKAENLIKEGLEKARKYDGTNDSVVFKAINDLSAAGELLSRAVVNLYNPEEVKQAVKEIVEETVEKMEQELMGENT